MDVQTIDNQYSQLHSQAQQTISELQVLAGKLQAAAAAGDQNAREWLLDLKSVAIAIQSEQNQVSNLLQAVHNFVDNQNQAMMQPQQNWNQPPMPMQGGYPQQGYGGGYPQQGGGMLGGLLNSGFGRAIMTGAGFGIGDDLINKIF